MESETPNSRRVKGGDAKFVHNLPGKSPVTAGDKFAEKRRQRVAELKIAAGDIEAPPPSEAAPFPQAMPRVQFAARVLHFEGYAEGVFANGLPCFLMVELIKRFAKGTGYSLKHTQDVSRAWMRTTCKFSFKRQRFYRSTCIVIVPRSRRTVISRADVRRRLVGAIRNYCGKSGGVDVGRKFLENFHSLHGMPPEDILYAWRTIYAIDGFVCQRLGRGSKEILRVRAPVVAQEKTRARQHGGRAKNLKTSNPGSGLAGLVSLPGIASGISPLTGEIIRKQGAERPDSEPGSSGSLRSQRGEVGEGSPLGVAQPMETLRDTPQRPGYAAGGDDRIPSGLSPPGVNRAKPLKSPRACHRWKPIKMPLHVCDRWIGAARIRRKANFLAFNPFQHAHTEFFRVRFRPAHAVNFADDALRAGYLDSEICAAYRRGLERAHGAAVRDLEAANARDYWHARERDRAGEFIREPSQVVSVAWETLRQDGRSDGERWAAIFAGHVVPVAAGLRAPVPAPGAATRADSSAEGLARPAGEWRTVGPGLRVRVDGADISAPKPARGPARKIEFGKDGHTVEYQGGPDLTPALKKAARETPQTIEQHMAARGLSLDQLLKLPRAEQQKFVREALAAQRAAGAGEKNPSQIPPFVKDDPP